MTETARPRSVGILIFPDVEILDFCRPCAVFASATLPATTGDDPKARLFDVVTAAERSDDVRCR